MAGSDDGLPTASGEPLVVFPGDWGSIAMGLVADDVMFVCFVGDTSESMASRCARRIQRTLVGETKYSLFLDAYSPEDSNLAARAQLVRALIAARNRIGLVVSLLRAPQVAAAARMVTSSLGASSIVTTDSAEFNRMLIEAAPLAHERIHPNNCVAAPASEPPPLRIVPSGVHPKVEVPAGLQLPRLVRSKGR